jgi:hypothetical protein
MTMMISAINLGYSPGNTKTFTMPQGCVILDCMYSKNNGLMLHYLIKDRGASPVPRKFVFYSSYAEPFELKHVKRYWHVGTVFQRFEPQNTISNGSSYVPDDIVYFVFEVE